MKFKINTIADTPTSTGKSKKTASLTDETNATYEKVGVWSDFPNYANLAVGQTVEGSLKTSPDGKWVNLMPPPSGNARGGGYTKPQGAITKAMDRKEAGIEKFQDSKELGIKISSTMRMAVDCAIAEYESRKNSGFQPKDAGEYLQSLILRWRKWLWENWDAKDTDFAPFPDRPDMRVREEDRNIKLEDITFDQPDPREEEYNQI